MEISFIYILSQIFTLINYVLLIASYQLKKRSTILIFNLLSLFAIGIAYFLLGGTSGLGMTLISIFRNIIFYIDQKKNSIKKDNSFKDVLILIIIYIMSIICAIVTYNGIWGLMSVFTTVIYTYSIWQKNTKVYKILGIPVGVCATLYNIYIKSILGVILETVLTLSATIGFLRENKESKIKPH